MSRQFPDGTAIPRSRPARGLLPAVIVVHLGSNGPITPCTVRLVDAGQTGDHADRELPRTWEDSVNSVLRAGAQRWRNATLLDWRWPASRHPEWLYDDGIHLRPPGATAYANLIGTVVKVASAR